MPTITPFDAQHEACHSFWGEPRHLHVAVASLEPDESDDDSDVEIDDA